MNRPSVSLCMIVKNEESHLPRLFKTFEGCFDEVHITDTGSTDNTVDIAKSLGAEVHHFKWINDFAAARNYSFSHAKTDYVMWLDADDELVSKEGFIKFRDTAMNTSDYWVARYDYSHDPKTGNSVCSFARERVIKRSKGMMWKYPIHEGILPIGGMDKVVASYTNAFHVKHVRTLEDLEKDRSRNLELFKHIGENLDARMRYYYGKELFEVGKPVEAAVELMRASADKNLEFHDRVLAMQYACYSYMACGQLERVIEIANNGTMLMPMRAEFWCMLGDSYLKLQKIAEALPAFSAAKACIMPPKNHPTAMFYNELSYTTYPRNQIARIYANLGDIDKAYLEAKECAEKYPNEESHAIKEEISKIKIATVAFKDAKECDDIVISCPPAGTYRWDPEAAKTKHMGGSETAAMEMAYHLHKLSGRPVKVFNDRDDSLTVDGVEYIPVKKLTYYFSQHKPYFHVAWRHNAKLTDAPTFVWSHDIVIPGVERTELYNKLLALSPFHKKYLTAMFGIPEDKILITSNGIKPERFRFDPVEKNPNKIIYSSSPDRGLIRVMKVLDLVIQSHPEIELHIFYGMEHLPKYGRQDLLDNLKAMIAQRPWIKYHGGVDQDTLMKHMRESVIWLYPTDFLETSCITAMEMVGNGVYPIVRAYGALPDTLSIAKSRNMASVLDVDCDTGEQIQTYANEVHKVLNEKSWERVKIDMEELSWQNVAKQWLDQFPKLFG